jgi:hypothetical protein
MPELRGNSDAGWAVWGASNSGTGVVGTADSGYGMYGASTSGPGVWGESTRNAGVAGISDETHGVYGQTSSSKSGVFGFNAASGPGVRGQSTSGDGVYGEISNISLTQAAVFGRNTGGGIGVYGLSPQIGGIGVVGEGERAARFIGDTEVWGDLSVLGDIHHGGTGGFRIDHPLDPENKYLQHSFVESPEMKNVYDGVEQLDEAGAAWVELPEWFGEVNQDYRYQLTAIGNPAPDLHVAEEIYENRFKIAGGEEGMKVSWQVTGVRKDEWAEANRGEVELGRSEEQRGRGPAGEPQRPPQPPELPPMPPGFPFGGLEEENQRQIDELRRQIEELRRRL